MVEVGVAQHHGIHLAQRRGLLPVAFAVQLPALEESAVQQHLAVAGVDEVS